jgi:signal peptidase I
LLLLVISVLTVHIVLVAWVGLDAARRKRNWVGWSVATEVFGIFGLLAWLIRRRAFAASVEPIGLRRGLGIAMTAPLLLALELVVTTYWTTFVFQVVRVDGQTMAPTLNDQDRLIVSKMVYQWRDPQPGDIVMLRYPRNPEKSFVKRVIAEQGDEVRIVGGRVYCNDVVLDEPFIPAESRSHDNWGPEVVPEGYYFVLGDRRNNSADSRHWGYVPKKYILGRVQYRWWPVSDAASF